ncbi:hypothetical protein [Nocardiopsis potens]|uniref:hypothetical protein n=1 Tax=Nocardiopsis potens TaxID=1246458 RepID=UPI000349D30E|nr:hypothetical protein [Nocardiopsis potens]
MDTTPEAPAAAEGLRRARRTILDLLAAEAANFDPALHVADMDDAPMVTDRMASLRGQIAAIDTALGQDRDIDAEVRARLDERPLARIAGRVASDRPEDIAAARVASDYASHIRALVGDPAEAALYTAQPQRRRLRGLITSVEEAGARARAGLARAAAAEAARRALLGAEPALEDQYAERLATALVSAMADPHVVDPVAAPPVGPALAQAADRLAEFTGRPAEARVQAAARAAVEAAHTSGPVTEPGRLAEAPRTRGRRHQLAPLIDALDPEVWEEAVAAGLGAAGAVAAAGGVGLLYLRITPGPGGRAVAGVGLPGHGDTQTHTTVLAALVEGEVRHLAAAGAGGPLLAAATELLLDLDAEASRLRRAGYIASRRMAVIDAARLLDDAALAAAADRITGELLAERRLPGDRITELAGDGLPAPWTPADDPA